MADWFDDFLGEIGIAPDSVTPNTDSGMSNNDILESIGLAFDGSVPDFASAIASTDYSEYGYGGNSKPGESAMARAEASQPKAVGEDSPGGGRSDGIIGRISNFVEKNKGLSEMLAKGIAGAALGSSNKKEAQIAAQSRLDQLKLQQEIDRQKSAAVSASVSGLRSPTGIVNRGQLKRSDGTPVYQNGRIV